MCKRSVCLFLVFGFCLGTAQGDLTMVPLTSWEITGDFGDVLSLNGYAVDRLIVGASEFAAPPGQSANEPAENADDFSLETAACADGQAWVKTVFSEPVRIIFILEKNGNDSGTIQGLDVSGNPVGAALSFTGGSLYWTSTGYLASLLSTQQIAYGAVLTSDVPVYGILITAPGIDPVSIMAVGGEANLSSMPQPAQGATDVPRNAVMSWVPGQDAQTHDVYFGTVLEDVNNANRGNLLDVLVRRDQDANIYDPGILEYGRTYYWRIDDVNAADSKVYKGDIWSFEVEPFAYPIPGSGITATASSVQDADTGPERTIDGSGLVDDLHSMDTKAMWLSGASDPGPVWIRYDFDKPYKLHQMRVWNYNGPSMLTGYGLRGVTVEYSEDGDTWTVLPGVDEFAKAPGADDYACNTTIDLAGVVAQSVKIIANSNWGGPIFGQYGLSEVRFLYVPVRAREPQPASGQAGVDPRATLSWRVGREAASHEVYLGADGEALALVDTVSGNSYALEALGTVELGQTYYWKVNEVNEAASPSFWDGDLWSFSTAEYLVVDDFESYDDDWEHYNRIFQVWIDGAGYTTPEPGLAGNGSGALVGTSEAPWVEQDIVHSGKQSMPLFYDNTGVAAYSETERAFSVPQDWTRAGARTLVLYFHGTPGNTGQLYVKVNGVRVDYDGDAADIGRPLWRQWNIDLASLGVDLQNVRTLGIGIDNQDATGTLYIDDIRLYASAPALSGEEIWIEAEAADTITAPMAIFSAIPGASGGEYIEVELGNNSTSGPPTAGGVASYKITVRGGTYKVNCRVIAPTGDDDSCWVRIQGATTQTANHSSGWVRWNDMAGGSDWQWDVVHSSDDGNAEVEWTMAAGTYTLEIAYREDGALIDAIMITKIVLPPPPTEEIWIEAEDADPIGALIQVVDDPTASGGKYITVEPGKNSTGGPDVPAGVAAWTFTVEGGTYKIEALLTTLADDDGDDSCWFRIQDAAINRNVHSSGWIRHNDARPRGGPWGLDEVHSSEDGNQTVFFTLAPGAHTLEWAYREDGLFLDAIKISNVVE